VQKLIRFQPEMIIAYTSTVYLLAQRFLMDGYNANHLNNLRGIIVSCDPCYPYQAEVIQAAFGAPIIVEYGCMEVGSIAYSHPDGTFRALEDRLIVETPMGLGGLPEVIVTDLSSFFQPLIRFAIDDNVQKSIAAPPQGIGFRTLGPIEGRVFDMVSGEGDRCLHGAALSDCVKSSYPDVLRYRFYQGADGFLRVELQLKPNARADGKLEKHLLTFLREELGSTIPIELVYVESFPQTLSGKFRMIVSEMPQAQRLGS
jgi:phenylacetate-CoA ligase